MIAADLARILNMAIAAKRDTDGNCLHARAYYQEFWSHSGEVCPDCDAVKLGGRWSGSGTGKD